MFFIMVFQHFSRVFKKTQVLFDIAYLIIQTACAYQAFCNFLFVQIMFTIYDSINNFEFQKRLWKGFRCYSEWLCMYRESHVIFSRQGCTSIQVFLFVGGLSFLFTRSQQICFDSNYFNKS